jgi:hypothetical protein
MLALSKLRRRWVIILVSGAVILWYATAYWRGMLMAYVDHTCGHYEMLGYGSPMSPEQQEKHALYLSEMRERYNVTYTCVAGCVVSSSLRSYVEGYNSVSRRLLLEAHDVSIFDQCRRLANEKWAAEHPED